MVADSPTSAIARNNPMRSSACSSKGRWPIMHSYTTTANAHRSILPSTCFFPLAPLRAQIVRGADDRIGLGQRVLLLPIDDLGDPEVDELDDLPSSVA